MATSHLQLLAMLQLSNIDMKEIHCATVAIVNTNHTLLFSLHSCLPIVASNQIKPLRHWIIAAVNSVIDGRQSNGSDIAKVADGIAF